MVLTRGSELKDSYHLKKCIIDRKGYPKCEGLLYKDSNRCWYLLSSEAGLNGIRFPTFHDVKGSFIHSYHLGMARITDSAFFNAILLINDNRLSNIWF